MRYSNFEIRSCDIGWVYYVDAPSVLTPCLFPCVSRASARSKTEKCESPIFWHPLIYDN